MKRMVKKRKRKKAVGCLTCLQICLVAITKHLMGMKMVKEAGALKLQKLALFLLQSLVYSMLPDAVCREVENLMQQTKMLKMMKRNNMVEELKMAVESNLMQKTKKKIVERKSVVSRFRKKVETVEFLKEVVESVDALDQEAQDAQGIRITGVQN